LEENDTNNDLNGENPDSGKISSAEQGMSEEAKDADKKTIEDLNNKYLRLYAEFENYKKRVNKDKEELVKYGNESLLYALLPAIDNLELALKHARNDSNSGLVQGVEMTLKELQRTLEKFGLTKIEADGKPFDPAVHHAMMKVERKDLDEMFVAEELRTGYIYREKVLRPSLVAVSIKPQKKAGDQGSTVSMPDKELEETDEKSGNIKIKINKKIEEES
jgi:molecular chaperone GrpE